MESIAGLMDMSGGLSRRRSTHPKGERGAEQCSRKQSMHAFLPKRLLIGS
jgi:hypothetical protein